MSFRKKFVSLHHVKQKDMGKDNKETRTVVEPLDFDVPVEDRSKNIIKVIGVGGGGCNAVSNMYDEGIDGVTFAVCNTDSQALANSSVPVKILLGHSGLGAGADPKLGREEAQANADDIERLLDDGTQMVFVTAGMGGGTGTGAAPVVAGIAKRRGILTVGVVTIPFFFEKKRKIVKALRGVDELRKNVDALLIVNNERLCDVYTDSDITIKEAFKRADNILKDGVKGISELITVHSDGSINLDFRDVETTMRNGGGAIMAMGRAKGQFRVENAIMDALDSPLLYGNDIGRAKRILFNIYASDDAPIFVREMQEIDEFFDLLDPNIDVIWGTSTDNTLGDDVKVTILATGMEDEINSSSRPRSRNEEDDEFYEELITKLYKPTKRAVRQIQGKHAEEESEDTPDLLLNSPREEHKAEVPHQIPQEGELSSTLQEASPRGGLEGASDSPHEELKETNASPSQELKENNVSPSQELKGSREQEKTETATQVPTEPSATHRPTMKERKSILNRWSSWLKDKATEMLTEPDE